MWEFFEESRVTADETEGGYGDAEEFLGVGDGFSGEELGGGGTVDDGVFE